MTEDRDAVARYGFLADPEGRRARGRRIARALADFGALDVAGARILDVGCSAGLITLELGRHARHVVGVDPDLGSLRTATGLASGTARATFVVAQGERLPFRDEEFDAVVCNHVYEHAGNPHALMREAHRVLRAGGVCYAATGHTFQLIEPHHRLPLLSMLPRSLADAWMRRCGKGDRYEERFLPPWRLRSLFTPFAQVDLLTPAMLRDPFRYELTSVSALPRPLRLVVRALAQPAAFAAPTWIWMAHRGGGAA